jgi:hypothetical protein
VSAGDRNRVEIAHVAVNEVFLCLVGSDHANLPQ